MLLTFLNYFLGKSYFYHLMYLTQNFKNQIKILHCAVLKRKHEIRKKNEKRKSKVKVSFTYEGGVGGFLKPAASAENALLSFPPSPPLTMQLIGSYMKENLYHCEIMQGHLQSYNPPRQMLNKQFSEVLIDCLFSLTYNMYYVVQDQYILLCNETY